MPVARSLALPDVPRSNAAFNRRSDVLGFGAGVYSSTRNQVTTEKEGSKRENAAVAVVDEDREAKMQRRNKTGKSPAGRWGGGAEPPGVGGGAGGSGTPALTLDGCVPICATALTVPGFCRLRKRTASRHRGPGRERERARNAPAQLAPGPPTLLQKRFLGGTVFITTCSAFRPG